jgi:hypothetical protein
MHIDNPSKCLKRYLILVPKHATPYAILLPTVRDMENNNCTLLAPPLASNKPLSGKTLTKTTYKRGRKIATPMFRLLYTTERLRYQKKSYVHQLSESAVALYQSPASISREKHDAEKCNANELTRGLKTAQELVTAKGKADNKNERGRERRQWG